MCDQLVLLFSSPSPHVVIEWYGCSANHHIIVPLYVVDASNDLLRAEFHLLFLSISSQCRPRGSIIFIIAAHVVATDKVQMPPPNHPMLAIVRPHHLQTIHPGVGPARIVPRTNGDAVDVPRPPLVHHDVAGLEVEGDVLLASAVSRCVGLQVDVLVYVIL